MDLPLNLKTAVEYRKKKKSFNIVVNRLSQVSKGTASKVELCSSSKDLKRPKCESGVGGWSMQTSIY